MKKKKKKKKGELYFLDVDQAQMQRAGQIVSLGAGALCWAL